MLAELGESRRWVQGFAGFHLHDNDPIALLNGEIGVIRRRFPFEIRLKVTRQTGQGARDRSLVTLREYPVTGRVAVHPARKQFAQRHSDGDVIRIGLVLCLYGDDGTTRGAVAVDVQDRAGRQVEPLAQANLVSHGDGV